MHCYTQQAVNHIHGWMLLVGPLSLKNNSIEWEYEYDYYKIYLYYNLKLPASNSLIGS